MNRDKVKDGTGAAPKRYVAPLRSMLLVQPLSKGDVQYYVDLQKQEEEPKVYRPDCVIEGRVSSVGTSMSAKRFSRGDTVYFSRSSGLPVHISDDKVMLFIEEYSIIGRDVEEGFEDEVLGPYCNDEVYPVPVPIPEKLIDSTEPSPKNGAEINCVDALTVFKTKDKVEI